MMDLVNDYSQLEKHIDVKSVISEKRVEYLMGRKPHKILKLVGKNVTI